jgi:hypothetical protein
MAQYMDPVVSTLSQQREALSLTSQMMAKQGDTLAQTSQILQSIPQELNFSAKQQVAYSRTPFGINGRKDFK